MGGSLVIFPKNLIKNQLNLLYPVIKVFFAGILGVENVEHKILRRKDPFSGFYQIIILA